MSKKKEKLPRKHKISFNLNDKEYRVFVKYLKKYRISNKAEFIRRALFTHILEQFDKDYPSLFSDEQNKNKE
jgi:hypothetical protein